MRRIGSVTLAIVAANFVVACGSGASQDDKPQKDDEKPAERVTTTAEVDARETERKDV